MRTAAIVSTTLFALASLAAACGDGASEDASSGDAAAKPALEKVIYAGSHWYGHAPVWAGIRQGIFKDAGFDVQDSAFGSSPNRVSALEAGAAQFASLGQVAMLQAMAEDRTGFVWIGNQNVAPGNEGLVAIGIDNVAGLRGKRIALNHNTSVHLTTALLLRQAGLDIGRDVEILRADDSAVVDLVRSGEADAGCIWEPYFSDLRNLPGARVLGMDTDTEIYTRFQTMTGPDVVCASRAWVEADMNRATRLLQAYFRAVKWCADNPEALVDLVAERVGKPREVIAVGLSNVVWQDGSAQRVVMSDGRLFGQAEYAAALLVDLELARKVPSFRDWTRPDIPLE
jgi:NitT/TauT family transport system substrate-binding protein